ncbi:hypothetical protein BDV18DRAFT_132873 [Aspergillus unguis]
MADFQHPLQCIQFVKKQNSSSRNVLVASAGAKLFSFAAESGQRLSVWPQEGADTSDGGANTIESNPEDEGPPGKKRKVDSSSGSKEEQKGGATTTKKSSSWTSIPILASTPDGEYLVALTGEDKCIRVFQVRDDGSFLQLSERPMPKRPCAITFMENNDILTGDKFGDVYSMPLLPSAEPRAAPKAKNPMERATRIAATNLTVHTKRNLQSLKMQMERRELADKAKNKDSEKPVFEHDLLLGHVSLLTDVAFASLPSPDPSAIKRRNYIISADRDEHIRVSRGRPQAHVIENNCLGHTSFISKLCVPEWAPEYLVSGGGDPHLLVWNWAAGELLHTVPVPLGDQTSEGKEICVRGIWASPSASGQRFIFVALEGNPTLQPFTLEPNGSMTAHQPIKASGNVLDVQFHPGTNTVIVSTDCIRSPGSTQEWRSSPASPATLIETFQVKQGSGSETEWEAISDALITGVNAAGTSNVSLSENSEQKEKTALNTSLYSLENLRKKQWDEEANL